MKEDRDIVCEILDNVSKKIGKPYKYLAPFEAELKKNWYDTPQALIKASDAQFQKMGIPLRVAIAIREELGVSAVPNRKQMPREIAKQSSNKGVQKVNQVKQVSQKKLTQASMLKSIGALEDELLKKYPWVGEDLLKIFETLLKVIKNIIADPYELKFRVLKKGNSKIKELFLSNPPVVKFLKEIGFEEDEQTLTLHRFEIHELYFVDQGLEAIIQNHHSQNPQQNRQPKRQVQERSPFLPPNIKFPENKQSHSLESAFSKQQLQQANYAQILDKLLEYRNQLMAQPPKDRKIRIYHKRLEVRQVQFQQCDLQKEIEHSDNSVLAKYWQNVLKMSRAKNNFQSRRKTEFEYLIKQKIYKETIIKVRLPNQLIIEARFSPLETLRDVFNLISQIVIGEVYLYQSPPVKRLDKQLFQTLENMHSVPNGSFYLGINNEWYIKSEYASITQK